MIDINLIRSNLDLVKIKLQHRFPPTKLDRVSELDQRMRLLVRQRDDLNALHNRESDEIGKLMKERREEEAKERRAAVHKIGAQIVEVVSDLVKLRDEFEKIMKNIPNLPHDTVPPGEDALANEEKQIWGKPREFEIEGFEPRDHVELATQLGMLDLERAAKITGARFAILTGRGARLERALISFCLDVHTKREDPTTKRHGYTEILPPFIVNRDSLFGTGQLPKFEKDLYRLATDEDYSVMERVDGGEVEKLTGGTSRAFRHYFLVPTAEVPLTNIYAGEVLDGLRLPIKMVAYTPCFRSEAGSYGKDTRGLIRQHQFDKVELVKITRPEDSYDELESLTRDAEAVLEKLRLPYRRVALSSGDLGFSAAKTYDIEVWLPSENAYREISSCSNCEAFQARRAGIRFRRDKKSKPEFAHTLNGSGLAIGRLWVALIENYQQADGSVVIPRALRPYMDRLKAIKPDDNESLGFSL
jgi:seryl-tRNA synthetase